VVKSKRVKYASYGDYYKSEADIFYPTTTDEIKEIILFAKENKRKITIAGSFHTFDSQNSGNDIVISLMKLNSIRFNKSDHTIEVGPGANWGNILKEAYRNYCVPFICITGTKPTAGGTLSAHTNSVFSPSLGKEGNHCIELDLLTTEGKIITCSRTQNSELFYGVISGLGLLGFITRIKYQLFYVGSDYEIEIKVKNYDNVDDLEKKFNLRGAESLDKLEDLRSQSSLFYFDKNKPKVAVYDRQYIRTDQKQKHFNIYLYIGAMLTFVIRFFPAYANKIMVEDEKKERKDKTILKGLHKIYFGTFWAEPDYMWMMYVSKLFSIFGYKPKLYQMTYFIPLEKDQTTLFVKKTCELLLQYKLHFSMFDIMYLPKDEPFVLSASRYRDGYYVNLTFFDKTNLENLMEFYSELNNLCIEMGGRINLVKNSFIEIPLLEKMFEKEIKELVALKKQTDPDNLIISNFFLEKFPSTFKK
jgi:FAD/FMN-containing dehydrogenase